MSIADDRESFEDKKRAQSLNLGRDGQIFAAATDLIAAANKYDYSYLWTWMGVPIIQLPADIIATQEIIWATKPDVIIETGVARGGSVLFMASILELIGKGKVIGVDIEIRAHNRDSVDRHPMSRRVTLIEGPSTDPVTISSVRAEIPPKSSVMVVLDSDHGREHVLAELRSYGPFVTAGCYLIVSDTLLGHLNVEQTPRERSKLWLRGNDPLCAVDIFLSETDQFQADAVMNGKMILASSPGGYLRRKNSASEA